MCDGDTESDFVSISLYSRVRDRDGFSVCLYVWEKVRLTVNMFFLDRFVLTELSWQSQNKNLCHSKISLKRVSWLWLACWKLKNRMNWTQNSQKNISNKCTTLGYVLKSGFLALFAPWTLKFSTALLRDPWITVKTG